MTHKISGSSDTLEKERKEVIKAAKDLRYSDEIIDKLMKAKSVYELTRIMKSARGSK